MSKSYKKILEICFYFFRKPKLPPKPSKLKLQSLQSPTNVCETNECDEYIKIIAEKEYLIEEKRRELIEVLINFNFNLLSAL